MQQRLLSLLLLGSMTGLIYCESKCLKDEGLGEATGNVYYCSDEDKPECCEQNSQFTCCETNESKTWREQAQLWGTVAGVAVLIILIFICCRYDLAFCNGDDRTLAQRFGLKKTPEPALTDLNQLGRANTTTIQPWNEKSCIGNLPPLPPNTDWETEKYGKYPPAFFVRSGRQGKDNSGYVHDDDDDDDDEGRYLF